MENSPILLIQKCLITVKLTFSIPAKINFIAIIIQIVNQILALGHQEDLIKNIT